jgi:hypothetical protein
MSHLLYLRSFTVDRFVGVFGGRKKDNVDRLLQKCLAPNAAPAARALVTKAVMEGLDGQAVDKESQQLLDAIVDEAIWTKSFGIGATPISPNGAGGPLFDAFAPHFDEAGPKARKLFAVLQRGRNYEREIVLLSPDDVATAAKILKRIADADESGDDTEEAFREELVEPFANAAKKGRAVFGRWG